MHNNLNVSKYHQEIKCPKGGVFNPHGFNKNNSFFTVSLKPKTKFTKQKHVMLSNKLVLLANVLIWKLNSNNIYLFG